jgi:hypothetical protein
LHKERLWEETEEEMKQTGKLNTFWLL